MKATRAANAINSIKSRLDRFVKADSIKAQNASGLDRCVAHPASAAIWERLASKVFLSTARNIGGVSLLHWKPHCFVAECLRGSRSVRELCRQIHTTNIRLHL